MKSEISGEFNSDVFCHLALGLLSGAVHTPPTQDSASKPISSSQSTPIRFEGVVADNIMAEKDERLDVLRRYLRASASKIQEILI